MGLLETTGLLWEQWKVGGREDLGLVRKPLTHGPGVSPRFYFWEYVGKPKNTEIYSSFRGCPRLNKAIRWVAFLTRPSQGRLRKN